MIYPEPDRTASSSVALSPGGCSGGALWLAVAPPRRKVAPGDGIDEEEMGNDCVLRPFRVSHSGRRRIKGFFYACVHFNLTSFYMADFCYFCYCRKWETNVHMRAARFWKKKIIIFCLELRSFSSQIETFIALHFHSIWEEFLALSIFYSFLLTTKFHFCFISPLSFSHNVKKNKIHSLTYDFLNQMSGDVDFCVVFSQSDDVGECVFLYVPVPFCQLLLRKNKPTIKITCLSEDLILPEDRDSGVDRTALINILDKISERKIGAFVCDAKWNKMRSDVRWSYRQHNFPKRFWFSCHVDVLSIGNIKMAKTLGVQVCKSMKNVTLVSERDAVV